MKVRSKFAASALLSLAGAVVSATAANAQYYDPSASMDSYGTAAPAPAPLPAADAYAAPSAGYKWGGAYVGGVLGAGWGTANVDYGLFSTTNSPSGATGGIVGGFNFNLASNFVLGAETDLTWNGLTDRQNAGFTEVTTRSNWQLTARGRAGVALDRILLYGTAGVAFNDIEVSAAGASNSEVRTGWVAGGGAEGAITQHITARAELLYSSFGRDEYAVGPTPASTDFSMTVLRGGIGYRF